VLIVVKWGTGSSVNFFTCIYDYLITRAVVESPTESVQSTEDLTLENEGGKRLKFFQNIPNYAPSVRIHDDITT
jgi:hypothetical protein